MKRLAQLLVLSLILFLTLALAVDNVNQNDVPETATSPVIDPTDIEDAKQTTNEILERLEDVAREARENESLRVQNATEIFTTPLPSMLESPTRAIFNIDSSEGISLEKFVILIGCTIIFLFILYDALLFSSFSESVNAIIALSLTVIASLLGYMNKFANGFYIILEKIYFIGDLDKKTMFITILIIIALLLLIKFFGNKLKNQKKTNKAYKKGVEGSTARKRMEETSENFSNAVSST